MAAPPSTKSRVPAIVDCLYNLITSGKLLDKNLPFDVFFMADMKTVTLLVQGKPEQQIALGWTVTYPEADGSIEALKERLQKDGFVRYNSRLSFSDSLKTVLATMGPNPSAPHPMDAALLDAMRDLRDMMGENGPEAMANTLGRYNKRAEK